jgi:hypothetical protein
VISPLAQIVFCLTNLQEELRQLEPFVDREAIAALLSPDAGTLVCVHYYPVLTSQYSPASTHQPVLTSQYSPASTLRLVHEA